MLLSLNWLKDYLQKQDLKIDPKVVADQLTMRGIQVASIKRPTASLENVVVGRIEKIEKHPNADRLQVTQVVTRDEPDAPRLQIVCGAKNIAEGDIVPIALPGSLLPGGIEIKISSLRGVESQGMICSGSELGIGEDGEGILQLPKHSAIGQPLSRLLGKGGGGDDVTLEFELTPNRSDCLSVIGIAREVAALYKTKLRDPRTGKFKITPHKTSSIIKVEVDDPSICPRYVARVIDGLKVTESPDWIKQRLEAVGIRPVNNIVDITNFVMMEYGQPLHAFDLRKIQSGAIRVATCKTPMDFTLLSGETVAIEPGDILIQDGDRPVALAGIMGGANSQIADDTTSIILESATFPAGQIRKTAKRLGLQSESSKRFEKGTDIAAVAAASERAAGLLRDSFNGNVYHPPIDTNEFGVIEQVISIDMRDVRKITGLKDLTAEKAAELLDSIDIPSHKKSINVLSVRMPTHRPDLKGTIDLIEEVARLVGYETIPENLPLSVSSYDRLDESAFDFERRARETMAALGYRETIHYSFVSDVLLDQFGCPKEGRVALKNPLSDEMKVLRTSLLGSLLQTYAYNKNRKVTDQKLFEIARTYSADPESETKVRELPCVAAVASGRIAGPQWKGESPEVDFYYLKGLLEIVSRELSTVTISYEPVKDRPLFHPHRAAVLKLGLKEVGVIGEVHPAILKNILETEEKVVAFELNLEALKRFERTTYKYKTPSKFPPVEFDIALLVDHEVTGQQLTEVIRQSGGNFLSQIRLFDLYQGDKIPEGKKSLAFHLSFLSYEKTLQDAEILAVRDKIVAELKAKYGAELRA